MDDRNHSQSDCFVSGQARDEATSDLYELLKHGSTPTPATTTGDDEGESTKGKTQLYEDPPGVETTPPSDDNQGFSAGVVDESEKVREGVLDKAFVGKANTDRADQKLIQQNFAHGKPGKFIAHSTHLKGEEPKKVAHPRAESLTEAVRRLT
jgi:hypothetical protein